MKFLQHITTLIVGICLSLLLCGCGLKGDLYLPEPSTETSSLFILQQSLSLELESVS